MGARFGREVFDVVFATLNIKFQVDRIQKFHGYQSSTLHGDFAEYNFYESVCFYFASQLLLLSSLFTFPVE